MFGTTKRCSRLLLQCVRGARSSSVQQAFSSLDSGVLAATVKSGGQCAHTQGRSYSTSSFWDVPHPARRNELFLELHTAKGMLPNRSMFKPMFTAHGVHLVPHRLPDVVASMLKDEFAPGSGQEEVPILADSVKRKRRLKIKKHKLKKRMKKMRHQM